MDSFERYRKSCALLGYTIHQYSDGEMTIVHDEKSPAITIQEYLETLHNISSNLNEALNAIKTTLKTKASSFILEAKIHVPGELIFWVATFMSKSCTNSHSANNVDPATAITKAAQRVQN